MDPPRRPANWVASQLRAARAGSWQRGRGASSSRAPTRELSTIQTPTSTLAPGGAAVPLDNTGEWNQQSRETKNTKCQCWEKVNHLVFFVPITHKFYNTINHVLQGASVSPKKNIDGKAFPCTLHVVGIEPGPGDSETNAIPLCQNHFHFRLCL